MVVLWMVILRKAVLGKGCVLGGVWGEGERGSRMWANFLPKLGLAKLGHSEHQTQPYFVSSLVKAKNNGHTPFFALLLAPSSQRRRNNQP